MESKAGERILNTQYILLTGANAGLGLATCIRLIDEFLATRPSDRYMHLVITTRSSKKGSDTISYLQKHLSRNSAVKALSDRISFQSESVELTNLLSVRALAKTLLVSLPKLDTIICNAGILGVVGLRWFSAVWSILSDTIHAATWPSYMIGALGLTTKKQLPSESPASASEPPLGEVFCANLFGHYMLVHALMPLLSIPSAAPAHLGRIIFVSTVEADPVAFSLSDPQCLNTRYAYQSSKRLTDILALSADFASTFSATNSFCSSLQSPENSTRSTRSSGRQATVSLPHPLIYVCHPSVVLTGIQPMTLLLQWSTLLIFYFARWLGSPWHSITPYKGAVASVWLALSPQTTLDAIEDKDGKGKWGSCTDRWGAERVMRTEVEGWGFGGVVAREASHGKRGRKRGVIDLTDEERQKFEELGGKAWTYMENLRKEWEELLATVKE